MKRLTLFIAFGLFTINELAAADSTFDELLTFLTYQVHLKELSSDPRAQALETLRLNEISSKSYGLYADSYKHYSVDSPPKECLVKATCFVDYLRFIGSSQMQEFLPTGFKYTDSQLNSLNKVIANKEVEDLLSQNLHKFVALIPSLQEKERIGSSIAKKKVWVLLSGHPLEDLQRKSITKFLKLYPGEADFRFINSKEHTEIFKLVGTRWNSGIFYNGELLKDVVTVEQVSEILLNKTIIDPGRASFRKLPIFDVHEHVQSDGFLKLKEILAANKISRSVIAALPKSARYEGTDQANEDMLTFSKKDSALLPLVILSQLDKSALNKFIDYKERGARGVKLMSGHGDYFIANHEAALDTPEIRKVFEYCEKHSIPVLWHVNSHLYFKGFLRALKEYPKLKVVAPHVGGYLTYAPQIVRDLLEQFPNLFIDLSFGQQLMYLRRSMEDISAKSEEWRSLIQKYPDRFLFGVDMVVTANTSVAHSLMLYGLYRSILEKENFSFHYFHPRGFNYFFEESSYHEAMKGLSLSEKTLGKLYWDNAMRVCGAAR